MVLVLVMLVVGAVAVSSRADDRIGDDEGVRRFELANGLAVVVAESDPGQGSDTDSSVQLWLLVDAGAIDELDHERGVSQVAAVLLRHGVGGFDEDAVGSMLVSDEERARYGDRARGVQVHFDQTMLTGHAPKGDAQAISDVLAYYGSVLQPATWDMGTDRFEGHRAWLRGRVEQVLDPMMTARQRWLVRMFGDGLIGTRLDLPELHEVDALSPATLRAYAERGFRASRATLVVVGDAGVGDLDGLIRRTLGRVPARPAGRQADITQGLRGGEIVFEHEPGWDMHQAVLVWDRTINDATHSEADARVAIVERVATELIRRRIDRLAIAEFGREAEIGFDRFELGNRLELRQCVVQREGTDEHSWKSSIGLLLAECERLARHGAGRDEIVQARGALLAGWHRDAEAWGELGTRERAGELYWPIKSGRPVLGASRWDTIATRMMSTISDAEINAALRELASLDRARVLVSVGGEAVSGIEGQETRESYVVDVRGRDLAALDPGWMRTLGGELIDDARFDGEITQVTQHAASGVWGATLGNGIRVWTRTVGGEGRVELTAMVTGTMFSDGSLSEAEIDAAVLAWVEPSTEHRDAGWLALYQENNGLRVDARRVVGGVRISVACDRASLRAGIELLYAMLDRPMIDAGAFRRWGEREPINLGDDDPLDRALAQLFRPEMLGREDVAVSLDGAQRALTRIVHNARFEIAIAGDVDAAATLEQAGEVLGMLTRREPAEPITLIAEQGQAFDELRTSVVGNEAGVALGMRGGDLSDLRFLRAMILASVVLDDVLLREARTLGYTETDIDAHVVMSDALGERWALVVRVRGGAVEECEQLVRAELERIASDGLDAGMVEAMREKLVASVDQYFDRAGYWSSRLSSLGPHGRTVDDLWTIREGYRAISADEATGALRSVMGRGDWFRVEVQQSAR